MTEKLLLVASTDELQSYTLDSFGDLKFIFKGIGFVFSKSGKWPYKIKQKI